MASSTSFDAVSNVGTRFHTQRINRRLDDRDNVIKEAVAVLEEKDRAYFPTVEQITFSVSYGATNLHGSNGNDIIVTLKGTQLGKTTDTHSIRLAGFVNTTDYVYFKDITPKANNDETEFAFTIDHAVFGGANGLNNPSAGPIHLLQVHVNGTLATEIYLTVGA